MTNEEFKELRDTVLQTDRSDSEVSWLVDVILMLLDHFQAHENRIKSLENDVLTHQHVSGDICAMYTEV
jgi:hypothetical protein